MDVEAVDSLWLSDPVVREAVIREMEHVGFARVECLFRGCAA